MKKLLILSVLAFCVLVPSWAEHSRVMQVGGIDLQLGTTPDEVTASLTQGLVLGWARDRLPQPTKATATEHGVEYERAVPTSGGPQTLVYRDEHGEHAFIASSAAPEERLALLVFEDSRLTRVTRIVGPVDWRPSSSPDLVDALVTVLSEWADSGDKRVVVEVSDLSDGDQHLKEVTFKSGERQLTVVQTGSITQLVENLGRSDIPVISSAP